MKDSFNKQKWTTAAGASATSFLEKWLRDKFDEAMHSMIEAYPFTKRFLQMFFDSDLNSEIERNAYMAITDAIISTVEELTKDGPLSKFRDIVVPVVHFVCKRLFLLKLAYLTNAGRISKEQFCERAAEHLAVETAAFLEKAWNLIPLMLEKGKVGLVGVLIYFGMDQASAIQTADNINDFLLFLHPIVKKFMTKDNVEKMLKRTIEITIDASRIVLQYAEQISDKAKQVYKLTESKLKSWGRAILQKFGLNEPVVSADDRTQSSSINRSFDKANPDGSKTYYGKGNPANKKNPFNKSNPAAKKDPFKQDKKSADKEHVTITKNK